MLARETVLTQPAVASEQAKTCQHDLLIRDDGTVAMCEECGGYICCKCGFCFQVIEEDS